MEQQQYEQLLYTKWRKEAYFKNDSELSYHRSASAICAMDDSVPLPSGLPPVTATATSADNFTHSDDSKSGITSIFSSTSSLYCTTFTTGRDQRSARSIFDHSLSYWLDEDCYKHEKQTAFVACKIVGCVSTRESISELTAREVTPKSLPTVRIAEKNRITHVARAGLCPVMASPAKLHYADLPQSRSGDHARTLGQRWREPEYWDYEHLVKHRAETKRLLGQESSWVELGWIEDASQSTAEPWASRESGVLMQKG